MYSEPSSLFLGSSYNRELPLSRVSDSEISIKLLVWFKLETSKGKNKINLKNESSNIALHQ